MQITFEVARALSILAFLSYGVTCLVTTRMVAEFQRYGLARFRRMVGALELLGAIGMLVGYASRTLLIVTDKLDDNVFLSSRNLPDVLVLTPRRFPDARGYFSETWNAARMAAAGLDFYNQPMAQDNCAG